MKNLKKKFKHLKKTGFFSIYIATITNKVITFFGGILIVRILSQNDYSIYTLVINAISILCLFGDFGSTSAMLQFGIENNEDLIKQRSYFKYSFKIALIASGISSILILTSKIFYPYKTNVIGNYSTMLFIIPIITVIINYFNVILRIKERNRRYSFYQITITVVHYAVILLLTLVFGLIGSLISQYIYNFIILLIGYFLVRKILNIKGKSDKLKKSEKKEFLKLSLGSQVNDTIGGLLYTVDIFVLGILITNTIDLSLYKVATVIPTALSFLPQCLMIYLIPYFIKNRKNISWLKKNIKKMFLFSFLIYGIITFGGIILSKSVITILYGNDYLPSVSVFNILMLNFFVFATFKKPIGNLLYCMHKVNVNLIINLLSLIINLFANFIFIKYFGYIGAAYSTLLITIFASIVSIIYLIRYLKKVGM